MIDKRFVGQILLLLVLSLGLTSCSSTTILTPPTNSPADPTDPPPVYGVYCTNFYSDVNVLELGSNVTFEASEYDIGSECTVQ